MADAKAEIKVQKIADMKVGVLLPLVVVSEILLANLSLAGGRKFHQTV